MSLEQLLARVQDGLPIAEVPELADAVHWTPAENLPVHRWFRYREGFSPKLLSYFPDSVSRLDPFCGCGTTLVESARHGVRSYGVDLNPLATFLADVKTRRYTKTDQREFTRLSKRALRFYPTLEPATRPSYALLDKLFLPQSMDVLLRLRAFIDSVAPGKVHDLLFLAWLSILESSSNVFKEGNGLKYRNKRRKPGQYVTMPDEEWIPRYFGANVPAFVERLWKDKCAKIAEDLAGPALAVRQPPRVITGSCLEEDNLRCDEPIDLAIFSPPYANRFDYFEAFKLELWMGGFVQSSAEMARLRGQSMRNNLAAHITPTEEVWPALVPFLEVMDESASSVRMGIKGALSGYFEDTRVLLRNLKGVLAATGRVVIVVGNSAYARSIVPTDVLIARLGLEEGYTVSTVKIARHLHVSSQQRGSLSDLEPYMRESVICLENHV